MVLNAVKEVGSVLSGNIMRAVPAGGEPATGSAEMRQEELLHNVGDVREIVFVLLERARELNGRGEMSVVDVLQLVANDLGVAESLLREETLRAA